MANITVKDLVDRSIAGINLLHCSNSTVQNLSDRELNLRGGIEIIGIYYTKGKEQLH
jgi:hypothetical protein